MRIFTCLIITLILGLSTAQAQQKTSPAKTSAKPATPETPHLVFVTEYIRQLSAYEEIREKGEQENAEAQKSSDGMAIFTSLIHSSTLFQLELHTDIAQLKNMRLDAPVDFLIPAITDFYDQKIRLWQQMSNLGTAFIGGPKPGIDYDQLAAEMPKIRANSGIRRSGFVSGHPGCFCDSDRLET